MHCWKEFFAFVLMEGIDQLHSTWQYEDPPLVQPAWIRTPTVQQVPDDAFSPHTAFMSNST